MSVLTSPDHTGPSVQRVLRLLKKNGNPGPVGQIAKRLDLSPPTVKRSIRILRDTGRIKVEDHGCRPNTYQVITQRQIQTQISSVKTGQLWDQNDPTIALAPNTCYPSSTARQSGIEEKKGASGSERSPRGSLNQSLAYPQSGERARSLEARSLCDGPPGAHFLASPRNGGGWSPDPTIEADIGSAAPIGDSFLHAAWLAGVVMIASNSIGVNRPRAA